MIISVGNVPDATSVTGLAGSPLSSSFWLRASVWLRELTVRFSSKEAGFQRFDVLWTRSSVSEGVVTVLTR